VLRVAFYKGFDKGGFADTWGPDNSDDDGRRFFGEAVNQGDVKALFFDLRFL
jgi:hypothetical protein